MPRRHARPLNPSGNDPSDQGEGCSRKEAHRLQAPVPSGAGLETDPEGVALFLEDEEPWRPVRILFVLGFSGGHFPAGPDRSPVFDPPDMGALKSDHGYALETPEEGMARRRGLFIRQLGVVGKRVVFLAPLRDAMGENLAPSGTITFMSRLFEGIQGGGSLADPGARVAPVHGQGAGGGSPGGSCRLGGS